MVPKLPRKHHRPIAAMRLACAVLVGSLAAACATAPGQGAGQGGGVDVVSKVLVDGFYTRLNTQSQLAGGAPVEVYGDLAADADAVAAALTMPGWFPPNEFFAVSPSAETRERDRIVLVFGAPPNVDGRAACRGTPPTTTNAGVVLAAYCNEDGAVSEGVLTSANLANPRDPAFAASMRGLFRKVLPRQNPERDRGEQCIPPRC